jgi:hypothetical protein
VPELLKGVCFTIARDGPDLYLKALEMLGIYVCATYKKGADLEMCLEAEELILLKNQCYWKTLWHISIKYVICM